MKFHYLCFLLIIAIFFGGVFAKGNHPMKLDCVRTKPVVPVTVDDSICGTNDLFQLKSYGADWGGDYTVRFSKMPDSAQWLRKTVFYTEGKNSQKFIFTDTLQDTFKYDKIYSDIKSFPGAKDDLKCADLSVGGSVKVFYFKKNGTCMLVDVLGGLPTYLDSLFHLLKNEVGESKIKITVTGKRIVVDSKLAVDGNLMVVDGPLERGNVLESQNIHVQKGVNTFIQKKTYLGGGKKLVLRFKSHLFLFVKDL